MRRATEIPRNWLRVRGSFVLLSVVGADAVLVGKVVSEQCRLEREEQETEANLEELQRKLPEQLARLQRLRRQKKF